MKGVYEQDLTRIFLYLHQKDKVEFMTVCKQWAGIINRNCLMETVRITSMPQLEKVYKKIRARRGREKQVRRLILDFHVPKKFEMGRYINQFPNLREVFMHLSNASCFQTTIRPIRSSTIERVDDGMGSALSYFFLTSYKCTQLKRLSVNQHSIGLNTPKNFSNLLLRYMPHLTKIYISLTTIALNSFESLHEALPALRSLTFSSTTLIEGGELREDVEPATALTKLDVTFSSEELSTQTKFLQYAYKKYPNLITLKYSSHDFDEEKPDAIKQFYKVGLIPLLKKLAPQLKKHGVSLSDMPKTVVDILDQIKLKEKFFHLGFTKKLSIDLVMKLMAKMEDDYEPEASEIGFQDVMENEEYVRFLKADRLKYIKNLTLAYDDPFDLKILKNFTALEGLELQLNSFTYDANLPVLDFNQVVEHLPDTVQYLELRSMPIEFDILPLQKKCKNMKRLELIGIFVDRGLDDLIAEYFPNLDRLVIDGVRLSQNKFDLTNLNLNYLLVKRPYYMRHGEWIEKEELNVVISAYKSRDHTSRREKRMYCVKDGVGWVKGVRRDATYSDAGLFPHVRNLPYVKGKGPKPTLVFELGSVTTVEINKDDMKSSATKSSNVNSKNDLNYYFGNLIDSID